MCEQIGYYGLLRLNGGFSEYVVVPSENAIKVKKIEIVHFGEIVLVALKALSIAENYSFLGRQALITGAGPVGLVTALVFKHYGWEVEICEIRDKRRNFASSLGFITYPIIHEVPEKHYSVVVDCAGEDPVIPYIFSDQISKVAKGGAIVLVGLYFSEVSMDTLNLLKSEINIIPSFLYTKNEISLLSDTLNALAEPLQKMSTYVSFDALIDALLEIETKKDNYIKVVLSHANNQFL